MADRQAKELATLGPLRAQFERVTQENVEKTEEIVRLKLDNEDRKMKELNALENNLALERELEEAVSIQLQLQSFYDNSQQQLQCKNELLETLTNENKMLKEQRAQLMRSNSTHANTEASKMLTDECFDQLKLKLEAVQDANAELTTAKKRLEDKLS